MQEELFVPFPSSMNHTGACKETARGQVPTLMLQCSGLNLAFLKQMKCYGLIHSMKPIPTPARGIIAHITL